MTGITTVARTGSALEIIQDIIHVLSYIHTVHVTNLRIYSGIQGRFGGTFELVVCVMKNNTFTQNQLQNVCGITLEDRLVLKKTSLKR